MTEIEKKALALVNEVCRERNSQPHLQIDRYYSVGEAFVRFVGQHEAFRQEVSDAVEDLRREWPEVRSHIVSRLSMFIIAKPDPLMEAVAEALNAMGGTYTGKELTPSLRQALAARGLKIVEAE